MNDGVDVEREVERMMAEVRESQERFAAVQQEISATEIVGSAERGAVTVRMNGGGRFTGVTIAADAVRHFPANVLGDVILEAITDAMRQLADLTRDRYSPFLEDPSVLDDAVTYYAHDEDQVRRHP
ncbi:MAG: YbaB/EbfC family nucleoid-associated protein [Kineosporiaceae bacterium]